ncbi:SDR family NAD(P)-dependent oxidoreductase [Streptomyces asiaticus]|uniref:SDR family NAD(P)-dependent oxidoreductase n=1 Tax=Streptomyces asiaticus TaxID=114695 RepID=UPI003D74B2B2
MSWYQGARIAVTGAAGGIGRATCAHLAGLGAEVYALDLTASPVGRSIRCDVTDEDSVAAAIGTVVTEGGRIDGLVAAAGVVEDDVPAERMSAAEFDRVLGVNLKGTFLSCAAAARRMLDGAGGRIVTVSSMSGTHIVNHPQKQSAYNASKAAVGALTRSLAVEWGPRGVRINSVAPGYVATPLNDLKRHLHPRWTEGTVSGRFAEPEEIAAAIGWLLGDEAAYCVGTELLMDGGFALR